MRFTSLNGRIESSVVENESANLNGTAGRRVWRRLRILEAGMRCENGNTSVLDRIEATYYKYRPREQPQLSFGTNTLSPFDKNKFLGGHPAKILPLVVLVECYSQRLALAVGGHARHREQVLLCVDGAVVAQREGPVPRGVLDGPPEVDDLEALFKQLRGVGGGEMAVHTRDGGGGRLVDMDPRDGLALACYVFLVAWPAAAEGCTKSYCETS